MINGYILDRALYPPTANMYTLDTTLENGYLKRESYSYFNKPDVIQDTRSTRLHLFSSPLQGLMELVFDADNNIHTPEEINLIRTASEGNKKCFFNIIEYLFYRTINLTRDQMDHEMTNDNDKYSNYIADSLVISVKSNNVRVYSTADTTCNILEWVEFKVDINGKETEVKLWANDPCFRKEYPFCTIAEVIFPLSQEDLLDHTGIKNIYDAINKSSMIALNKLNTKMASGNYTGYQQYETKHINKLNELFLIPFSILYKGRKPTTIEIREKIKSKLDYVLATEQKWRKVLPDLFVDGRFFCIPYWDIVVFKPDRAVYPSIMRTKDIMEKTKAILPSYKKSQLEDMLEIISITHMESMIGIVGDLGNDSSLFIGNKYPLYQHYASTDISFNYMPDNTQLFSKLFNRAVYIATGEEIDNSMDIEVIDGKEYVVFIYEAMEYLVITKNSYNKVIGG